MGIEKTRLSNIYEYLDEVGVKISAEDAVGMYDLRNLNLLEKEGVRKLVEQFEKSKGNIDNTIKIMKLSDAMVTVDGQAHKKLKIKYVRQNGDIQEYTILPLDIDGKVCNAIDAKTNDLKDFNLDRITEISDEE